MGKITVHRNGKGNITFCEIPVEGRSRPMQLYNVLGVGDKNPKLLKSNKSGLGYMTVGLPLAPHKVSGYQVCPHSTPGCRSSCIFSAGHAQVFQNIGRGRIARTRLFFEERDVFAEMLRRELRLAEQQAASASKLLAVRLNIFSDIAWEKVFPWLFDDFFLVQFYDYTKNPRRAAACAAGLMPRNYSLCFSRSENNQEDCLEVLRKGGNVSVVFGVTPKAWKKGNRPKSWYGWEVTDGDRTDLRFLDPPGTVTGLYAKGSGRKDASGFVVRNYEA